MHRDIKLENILFKSIDSWEIVLIDFGMSEHCNEKENLLI